MPRESRNTRERIIEAAYELFYKCGFARVGVDAIAAAAQVTKRTLYYHFDSKDALIAAVLEAQSALALERIQRWATRARGDASSIVEGLFAELGTWAKRRGWQPAGFTRIAMELADLPGHPARLAARRHKSAVESWLAMQFADTGLLDSAQVACEVMLLIEGCHALLLIHGDTRYISAATAAARLVVEQHRVHRVSGSSDRRPNARRTPG